MIYINVRKRGSKEVETVDRCDTLREAHTLAAEYRMAYPEHDVWESHRCCDAWAEDMQESEGS